MDFNQALDKLKHYCAYQERCHSEVRSKGISIKIYGDQLEEVISMLVQENYLNEERFAKSYVRGKYRMKKWGRKKILMGLKSKFISSYCIKKGMEEIEEDIYENNLHQILLAYCQKYEHLNRFERRKKSFNYAFGKGYEMDKINEVLDKVN